MDLDDTNLEISIEPSSNQSHEQTSVAGASSVPQDESRGLNEMTPEDLDSLKKQVCKYARKDKWKEAESIFNKYADMVRTPLTGEADIALHVAVRANRITFVKGLVNLMTPQDLEIQNLFRETAFLMAAKSGNSDLVQIMIEKNQNLPLIKVYGSPLRLIWTYDGMLPVHRAAMGGHHKIVQDLSSKTLLQKMNIKDIEELFFQTIEQDMFDVATNVFEEYPDVLAIARSRMYHIREQTALEMLLRKPSKELMRANRITFVKGLVNLMTPQDLEIQSSRGNTAFLMAARSGNSDLVQIMIEKNQKLPLIRSTSDGRLPVHWAAIEGHHKIVQDLSSKTLLQKMDIKDIEELFFQTIEQDLFDVATKLFEEYPSVLAIARSGIYGREGQTALEMLLRKPSKELIKIEGNNRRASWGESLQILLKKVWLQLKRRLKSEDILRLGDGMILVQKVWHQLETQLESEKMERLKSELLPVLFNIIESGNNDEAVKLLLREHGKLLIITDPCNGQSILHYAVRKRRSRIIYFIRCGYANMC